MNFTEITLTPESEDPAATAPISEPADSTLSFRFKGLEFGCLGGNGLFIIFIPGTAGDEFRSDGGAFSFDDLFFRYGGGVSHFCLVELGFGLDIAS